MYNDDTSSKLNKIKNIKKSFSFLEIPPHIKELAPNVKFESFVDNILSIKMPNIDLLPPIPPQYGYKGGAARLALGLALNYNFSFRRPRDIDVVRFGSKESTNIDKEIEKAFMAEDSKYGHGIEVLSSIETYFSTRDITINEILILNNTIYFTLSCLVDLYHKVLRPTDHVLDKFNQADPKISMKILRLKALSTISGEEFSLSNDRYNPRVTSFHIALHLDRALDQNSRIATEYIYECVKQKYLPDFLLGKSAGDTISYLYMESPSILSLKNLSAIYNPFKKQTQGAGKTKRILL